MLMCINRLFGHDTRTVSKGRMRSGWGRMPGCKSNGWGRGAEREGEEDDRTYRIRVHRRRIGRSGVHGVRWPTVLHSCAAHSSLFELCVGLARKRVELWWWMAAGVDGRTQKPRTLHLYFLPSPFCCRCRCRCCRSPSFATPYNTDFSQI